jgi:hypothetical protein
VGGFAAPQLALLAIFTAAGALGDYWYAIAGSLGLYAEAGPQINPLARFAGYVPALLAVAYLLYRKDRGAPIAVQHLPLVWLGFSVAGATSSAFGFPHYLQQAAPAAVLVAVVLPQLLPNGDQPRRAPEHELLAAAMLAVVVAVVFGQFSESWRERRQVNPVLYYRNYASHEWGTKSDLDYEYFFDGKAVAVRDIEGVLQDDDAGRTLFTWSELPWLYASPQYENPARYYTSFLGEIVPDAKPEIMRDLTGAAPVYIVMSEDTYAPFPELEAFVDRRYELVHAQGDWRVYRLSTAEGRLPVQQPPATIR